MSATAQQIFKNTLTGWIGRAARALTSLLLVPFIIGHIGRDNYGLMVLIASIVGICLLLDMGLRAAMSRNLAEQLARRDDSMVNRLLSSGLAMYLLLGLGCSAALFAGAPLLVMLLKVPVHLQSSAASLIRWFGTIEVMVAFAKPPFGAFINARNRFDLNNLGGVSRTLLNNLAIFLVLRFTALGLFGWAVVIAISDLLSVAFSVWMCFGLQPNLKIGARYVDRGAIRSLFSIAGYLVLSRLSNGMKFEADPLVLNYFLGPGPISIYRPALSMTYQFRPLVMGMASQLCPLVTQYHATGRIVQIQQAMVRAVRLTFLLGMPVAIYLFAFADPISRLWLGRALGPDWVRAAQVMRWLAVLEMLYYFGAAVWWFQLAMNRIGFVVVADLVFGIVNLAASVFLVARTSLGVAGVVIPSVLVETIARPLFVAHAARCAGLHLRDFAMRTYARPTVVLSLTIGSCVLVHVALAPSTILGLMLALVLVGAPWAAATWTLGMDGRDRELVVGVVARFIRPRRREVRIEPELEMAAAPQESAVQA